MLHTVRFHLYSEKGKTMETTKFRGLEGVWMNNSQSTEDFGGSKNNVKKKMLKDGYMLLHICPN